MDSTDIPDGEVVDRHIHCVECGYDLFGLDPAGRCPECGADIVLSARGDLLKFANADWLRRVKLGADLMYYGIGVAIVVGLAGGILSTAVPVIGPTVVALGNVGVGAFFLAALFLMTTQEPRVSLSERELTWRRLLRLTAVLNFVAGLVVQPWTPQLLYPLVMVASVIQAVSLIFMCYGYFAFAETFAVRIPNAKMARSTRIVKWGLTIFQALFAVSVVGMILFRPVGPGAPAPAAPGTGTAPPGAGAPAPPGAFPAAFMVLGCAVLLTYLFFALWALRLLRQYRRELKTAIDEGGVSN